MRFSKETEDNFVRLSTIINQYFDAKKFNEEVEAFTKLEWYILNLLGTNNQITQDELLKIIPTDKIPVRRAIRRLGRNRFIHHVTIASDLKEYLALTPKGEKINAESIKTDERISKELIGKIPEDKKEAFESSVNAFLDCITD